MMTGRFNPWMAEDLLKSGDFSDFVLTCEDKEFKIHRAIVAPACPFFKSLVGNGFKEGTEGKAAIQETSALALASLLLVVYTGSFELTSVLSVFPDLAKPGPKIRKASTSSTPSLSSRKRLMQSRSERISILLSSIEDTRPRCWTSVVYYNSES